MHKERLRLIIQKGEATYLLNVNETLKSFVFLVYLVEVVDSNFSYH